MKPRLQFSLILATLLAATVAVAAEPPPAPRFGPPVFADFDTNGDGALTEQEFNDSRNKRIAERAAAGFPMRGLGNAEDFGAIDSNGDGKVTPDEFAAHQRRHMQGGRPPAPAQ